MSSQSSHHPQEVLLARFSLYVHKGGLKPDSFHFSNIKTLYMTSSSGRFLCRILGFIHSLHSKNMWVISTNHQIICIQKTRGKFYSHTADTACAAQQTWCTDPILFWCWASFIDSRPALKYYWVSTSQRPPSKHGASIPNVGLMLGKHMHLQKLVT